MSNFDKHVAVIAAQKFQADPALQATIKTLQDFEAYVATVGTNLTDAERAEINQAVELELMGQSTLEILGNIAGKPVTVQFAEEDGTATGELKPTKATKAKIKKAVKAKVITKDALEAAIIQDAVDMVTPAEIANEAALQQAEAVFAKQGIEIMSPEKQGLAANSVLMRMGFGVIGNSKKAYVAVETKAEQTRFKVHKTLLNSPELKAISKADMRIRQFVYKESIPFDMGSVLLSYAKLDFVSGVLDNYREVERPALVAEFVKAYPARVDEAKAELKEEFNAKDFPEPNEVSGSFVFEYKLMGFDVPGELASINKAVYAAQVEKAKAQIADVTHEIQQAQRAILFSLVDNLAFKLMPDENGKTRVINKGAVEKLQKFLVDFDFNNVTGDAETKKLCGQLKALTEGASPETFKNDAELKAATAAKLVGIQDSLEGLLEVKPERKYKDLDEVA
jgi:hypothetical protein